MMRLLADGGADLDTTDEGGYTALHYAANQDLDSMAAVFLSAGAKIEVRDDHDRSSLSLAMNVHSSNVAGLLLASTASKPHLLDADLSLWAQQQP